MGTILNVDFTAQDIEKVTANEIVTIVGGKAFTTSQIVAKVFSKNHKDVLKAIDNLECSPGFRKRNFAPTFADVPGPNGAVRQSPAYNLTRDGFIFLAMGFTGSKAAAWKEKFLEAFNAMEIALAAQVLPPVPLRAPSSIPPLGEGAISALKGVIAYWAYMDNIGLQQAESYLCGFFRVRRLQDLPHELWEDAWSVAWNNAQRVSRHGESPSEEQRAIVEAMLCACRQFKGMIDFDFKNLVMDSGEMDSLSDFSAQDVPKVVACLWGILNQVLQYTQCRQIRHAE